MGKLFIYNPTCDMAVENGTNSYMPTRLLSKFENDISPVMAFLGTKDDFVLYNNILPESFINFWRAIGIELPAFVQSKQIYSHQINALYPWGWSQIIKHRYGALCPNNSTTFLGNQQNLKSFFSRQTSLELTHELNKYEHSDFVAIPELPKALTSSEAIRESFLSSKHGIVIKTLWSSSGRGLLFIRTQQQLQNAGNWIDAQIKKNGSLIIEPIYDKVQDASLQFMIHTDQSIQFLGLNYFEADNRGHFSKEYIHIPESINSLLPTNNQWLSTLSSSIISCLNALKIPNKYQGPIGIDSMFIKDAKGQLKFYPLVEANIRCNMGLVNLIIKQHIHPEARGTWQISQFKTGEAQVFHQQHLKNHPLRLIAGKIRKGFFPLTPFSSDSTFAAWGLID